MSKKDKEAIWEIVESLFCDNMPEKIRAHFKRVFIQELSKLFHVKH